MPNVVKGRKYNWEGTNYQSGVANWKIFEKNNPAILFDVLYKRN